MFNNPNPDVDIPQSEENNKGDGMNVDHKCILEIEGWKNPYILHQEDYQTLPSNCAIFILRGKKTSPIPPDVKTSGILGGILCL